MQAVSLSRAERISNILLTPLEVCGRRWHALTPMTAGISVKKIGDIALRIIFSMGTGLALVPGILGAVIKVLASRSSAPIANHLRWTPTFNNGSLPGQLAALIGEGTGIATRVMQRLQESERRTGLRFCSAVNVGRGEGDRTTITLDIQTGVLDILRDAFDGRSSRDFTTLVNSSDFLYTLVEKILLTNQEFVRVDERLAAQQIPEGRVLGDPVEFSAEERRFLAQARTIFLEMQDENRNPHEVPAVRIGIVSR